jgi:hypothetical protein
MLLSHGLFSNMGFPLRNVRPSVLTIFLALRLVLINFLLLQAYRDSVVGVEITLQAEWSGVRIPARACGLFCSQKVQTGCGAYLASYSVGTGTISRKQSDRCVTLATHFPSNP